MNDKKTGQVITAVIRKIRLHQEERMMQGEPFGTYVSNYVAELEDTFEVIMAVDSIAKTLHPDWKSKTEERAAVLSKELCGRRVRCEVIEVASPTSIECEFIELL